MKKVVYFRKIAMLFFIAIVAYSCSDDSDEIITPVPLYSEEKSIYDILVKIPELSLVTQAVNRAGLHSTLDNEGGLTVYAPTNDAIESYFSTTSWNTMDNATDADLYSFLNNSVIFRENMLKGVTNSKSKSQNAIRNGNSQTNRLIDNGSNYESGSDDYSYEASNGTLIVVNKVRSVE